MILRRLAAAAVVVLLASPALAQQAPAAPTPAASSRCTGIFCDIYYAGRPEPAPGQPDIPSPTSLPCHDFVCGMFGGRTPDAPPPPVAQQAAAEAMSAEAPAKPAHHARKKKHIAMAEKTAAAPSAR